MIRVTNLIDCNRMSIFGLDDINVVDPEHSVILHTLQCQKESTKGCVHVRTQRNQSSRVVKFVHSLSGN